MNILHIVTPSGWRGGEQQAAYLIQALAERGVPQQVICREGSRMASWLEASKVPVITFHRYGLSGLSLSRAIARVIRQGTYTCIHAHDSHAHSASIVAALLFGVKVPIVVSRRVDFPVSSTIFSSWKYNHRSIHKIICVSQKVLEVAVPAIRQHEKLCVVHDGIDVKRMSTPIDRSLLRRELGLSDKTVLVGNISALADHKDHLTFVSAAAAIHALMPDVHFVLAGSGPEENRIREQIHRLGMQERIHLLGHQKDIVPVMKSLDVFLMTSSTEGLGSIVLDAFAAGVPVVSTDAGGLPEIVHFGTTGLLAPVGDGAALALKVIRLLADNDLREGLREQALEYVKDFDYHEMARKTIEHYPKS